MIEEMAMSLVVEIRKKVKGFSLDINFRTDGLNLGILGASGSGKSMTLKCIAGVEKPDEGRIILNGKVLFDSDKRINLKPQDRNVGYLFQNYALFPHMTVEENIGAGLRISNNERGLKISESIESFHLQGMEKKYPNQLSGGQQQRVALARAIVYRPDILLLDEPFSALDSYLKEQLQIVVLEMLKFYDGEVLMVTHSSDEIYRFTRRLAIMDRGRMVLSGDTKEIFRQPLLLSAARLTGCRNISRCKVLSSNTVYAINWGMVLETEMAVPEKTSHIGLMSNAFEAYDPIMLRSGKNVIECRINEIMEDVSGYNVYFESATARKEDCMSNLLYKVPKDEWNNRADKKKVFLRIPENAILLLE